MTDDPQRSSQTNGNSHKLYEPAISAIGNTAAQLRKADTQLIERVRKNPIAAVAVAVALGYLVGRVFSRYG